VVHGSAISFLLSNINYFELLRREENLSSIALANNIPNVISKEAYIIVKGIEGPIEVNIVSIAKSELLIL